MSQQERVSLTPAMAGCVGLSTACNTCRGVLHQMNLALLGAAGEYTCTCYNVGPSRRPGLLLLCTILCSPLSLTTPVVAPANLHRFGFCEVSWKAAVGAAGTMTALYAGINLAEHTSSDLNQHHKEVQQLAAEANPLVLCSCLFLVHQRDAAAGSPRKHCAAALEAIPQLTGHSLKPCSTFGL